MEHPGHFWPGNGGGENEDLVRVEVSSEFWEKLVGEWFCLMLWLQSQRGGGWWGGGEDARSEWEHWLEEGESPETDGQQLWPGGEAESQDLPAQHRPRPPLPGRHLQPAGHPARQTERAASSGPAGGGGGACEVLRSLCRPWGWLPGGLPWRGPGWRGKTATSRTGSFSIFLQTLVEIKCPLKCLEATIETLASTDPTFCLRHDGEEGRLRLKDNHNYYYQIQGQLHCARRWEQCSAVLPTVQ